MAASSRITPGREGYKVLFNENRIIVNQKFAAAAAVQGSREYQTLRNIRMDFPDMVCHVVSGRVQTTAKANRRLTYANMEKHISVYENASELLAVFETVKAASATVASPYKYVCDWFKAQFPDYNKPMVFKDGKLAVVPLKPKDTSEYKQKLSIAG